MSDCNDALHELYEFIDGELTAERRALIEGHLHRCSPCLEAYDFHAELRIVVSQKCREEVPEALRRRIASALDAEPGGTAPA
ncbi:MAG: mycothiol system anti-sigma-R factor [Actinobacteria bacterium]|nr:mycothiol system anti-sigma-R factor [Actinomycetota bacterium]